MVTVSHMVEKLVSERPLLLQAIEEDIVSFGNLAEKLETEIAEKLGKEVRRSAVVMALRRFSEKAAKRAGFMKFNFDSEVTMKTNLCLVVVKKSSKLSAKLYELQKSQDIIRGDTLNIIHGSYEVTIVTNMRSLSEVRNCLSGEDIIRTEKELVALSLRFSEKFLSTPGVIATIVQRITWEGINIHEMVSSYTELALIVSKKDAVKGYEALQRLVS